MRVNTLRKANIPIGIKAKLQVHRHSAEGKVDSRG